MDLSGLIYAAIAIMWAAVLIPMWLRNHDSATESRSVERFGQAMRVLRREQEDPVDVAHPAADRSPQAARDTDRASAPRRSAARPVTRRPQRTLAQRRARTLFVLLGLTLAVTVVALISPLPWWTPVPVALLLVAFVTHLRVQARQRQQRQRAARVDPARAQRESVADDRASDEPVPSNFVSGPSRAVVVETKGDRRNREDRLDGSAPADDVVEWEPNPLPLPTYVTAPKAVRPIKVIDLTTPGAWSSGRLLEDDIAPEDLLAAEVAEDELDALLEHEVAPQGDTDERGQRAVGD